MRAAVGGNRTGWPEGRTELSGSAVGRPQRRHRTRRPRSHHCATRATRVLRGEGEADGDDEKYRGDHLESDATATPSTEDALVARANRFSMAKPEDGGQTPAVFRASPSSPATGSGYRLSFPTAAARRSLQDELHSRFWALPAAVALVAMGRVSPYRAPRDGRAHPSRQQHRAHRFGAQLRELQVVFVGSVGVGVTLDQHALSRDGRERLGDLGQARAHRGLDVGLVDVEVDAAGQRHDQPAGVFPDLGQAREGSAQLVVRLLLILAHLGQLGRPCLVRPALLLELLALRLGGFAGLSAAPLATAPLDAHLLQPAETRFSPRERCAASVRPLALRRQRASARGLQYRGASAHLQRMRFPP